MEISKLRGVDVKVNSGEIVTLIGSNGAGKSTLLMTISGVNKASTGEILFDDQHIENLPPHEIVNLEFHKYLKEEEFFQDFQ